MFKLLRNELEPCAEVAWIFGSFVERFEKSNDVDLAIVVDNRESISRIHSKLPSLSEKIGKNVHVTSILHQDAFARAEHNDYLLASLLVKKRYVFGNRGLLDGLENEVFASRPTQDSVRFNMLEGIRVLGYSLVSFDKFRDCSRRLSRRLSSSLKQRSNGLMDNRLDDVRVEKDDLQHYLAETIRNIPLSLGYLIAATRMKELNRTVTLSDIERRSDTGEGWLFDRVYEYCRGIKMRDHEACPLEVERCIRLTLRRFENWDYGTWWPARIEAEVRSGKARLFPPSFLEGFHFLPHLSQKERGAEPTLVA